MTLAKKPKGKTRTATSDLLQLAKQHHIYDASLSKTELIRSIQISEGNFDCYASASKGECDQSDCSWREDCFVDSGHRAKTDACPAA